MKHANINDFLRNGMTSWWWRYLIFIAPGVILVVTNALSKKIENGSRLYFVCYLAMALVGISSIDSIANNRSMVDFMIVMQECNSDKIDVLRALPDIDSVENRIRRKDYSDVYALYASDELIGNLESQFNSKMEKLDVKGISPMWRITIE